MIRRQPRSTRTDPLLPYPTLFRSTLAFRERIGPLMDFQLGLVALAPGFGEADIRIGAKRDALLLSMHGVFEPPQARTGRVHLDVEAVGIGNFVDAIPWFEGPDLNIAKRQDRTSTRLNSSH